MAKLSTQHLKRWNELNDEMKLLDAHIIEKINDPIQPLPLNLIMKARFNVVMMKGIELESSISEIEANNIEGKSNTQIDLAKRRLERIHGSIGELQAVNTMLQKYDDLGRCFEIAPLTNN